MTFLSTKLAQLGHSRQRDSGLPVSPSGGWAALRGSGENSGWKATSCYEEDAGLSAPAADRIDR